MDSSGNFNIVIQNADGSITTKRIKGAGMPEPATPLTRTEQKAYDSYAVEIESYPDRESALSDLQTNRSTIIKEIGQNGYDKLVAQINTQLSIKSISPALPPTHRGTRNFLNNLFSVNPISPVGSVTIKPLESFFSRLFAR